MKKKEMHRDYDFSLGDLAACTKLRELYVNSSVCVDANLYRDGGGRIVIFWYWLTNHGIGPSHCAFFPDSPEELKLCLYEDAERGWVSRQDADRLCRECRVYFDV